MVELEAQPQQQPPLEDAGRNARVTDGTQQDGVVLAKLVQHRVGQELARPLPAVGTEVVGGGLHARLDLTENLEGLVDDFRTDAVSGDHCQAHGSRP